MLSDSKLLEDEEVAVIEDQVADAIVVAGVEYGADRARNCVMQMTRVSEGIASEKMFARQLRRKFLHTVRAVAFVQQVATCKSRRPHVYFMVSH